MFPKSVASMTPQSVGRPLKLRVFRRRGHVASTGEIHVHGLRDGAVDVAFVHPGVGDGFTRLATESVAAERLLVHAAKDAVALEEWRGEPRPVGLIVSRGELTRAGGARLLASKVCRHVDQAASPHRPILRLPDCAASTADRAWTHHHRESRCQSSSSCTWSAVACSRPQTRRSAPPQ